MIERHFDEETGIVYVTTAGRWTIAEVDAHYDALRALIVRLREAGRPVRILSDLTGSDRQSHEIEAHVSAQILRTYGPGDRIAAVTKDAADKAYVRRIANGHSNVTAFASRLPAEMWLLLDPGMTGPDATGE